MRFMNHATIDMMIERDKVNNEYYTCPTYNYLVEDGLNVVSMV